MRIVQILGSSAGGVGTHVQGLVSSLVAAGHHVCVACPSAVEGQFGFVDRGAAVVPVEISDRPRPRDAAAIRALRSLAAEADVIHAHGLRAGALAALALVAADVPLVVTTHNAAPTGRVTAAVYSALERLVAARADLVLGVSADLVDRARSLGARAVDLAVVAAPAPPAALTDRASVRSALGLGAACPLLVSVARLAPQKDLGVLLDAVAELAEPFVLVIAGEGPMRAELAARIRQESLPVRLLGHRRDIPDLLAAADVVVSSARWEGQPVWLQEALFSGAAIVATDAGGTRAVLGDAALLVPVGDPRSLTAALRDVLTHEAVATDLRRKATRRAGELPDAEQAAAAALTAYQRVRASPRQRTFGRSR